MLQKVLDHDLAQKHESYMLCLDKPGAMTPVYEKQVKKIWFLPKRQFFSLKVFSILKEMRRLNPDVTMGWMYRGMLMAWLVKKKVKTTRLVWTVRKSLTHIKDEKLSTRLLIRLLARISSLAVSTVYNSKDAIEKHIELGFDSTNTKFIPNGFDSTKFFPSAKDKSLENKIGLDPSVPTFSVVARFHPCKGHALIVDAASNLKKEGLRCQFLFVGKGFKTMPGELQEKIQAEGLENWFYNLGAVSDTSKIYNMSDSVVSSSYIEGFSNSIGEALFCNTPVFTSDAGDSAYVVGDPAFVFPSGDHIALSGLIAKRLNLPAQESKKTQKASFERARELFSIDKVGESYYSVMIGDC